MRRVLLGLLIGAIVFAATPAWARWVWRDGKWQYVDGTQAAPRPDPRQAGPASGAVRQAPRGRAADTAHSAIAAGGQAPRNRASDRPGPQAGTANSGAPCPEGRAEA